MKYPAGRIRTIPGPPGRNLALRDCCAELAAKHQKKQRAAKRLRKGAA